MRTIELAFAALFVAPLFAQDPPAVPPPARAPAEAGAAVGQALPGEQLRSASVLGPDDQITIHALDADEISDKPLRIDTEGFIRLPMVGRLKASGLTVEQLENEIASRLKQYIKDPEVVVSLMESHSQPVSVIGSVKIPGVQQVQGRKTILEVLAMAGGIDADAGGARITRRKEYGPIPLRNAATDSSGEYFVADLDLGSLLEARNPQENIEVKPNDVISVSSGELVYVIGQVRHPGGFVLRQRRSLSALQAVAMAEGFDKTAKPQQARILRVVAGAQQRAEIPVDLRKILASKSSDVPLMPNDILFVPSSTAKSALARGLEAVVQIATYGAIYRIP
jgi:polysaccharide export outer membrane protein